MIGAQRNIVVSILLLLVMTNLSATHLITMQELLGVVKEEIVMNRNGAHKLML